MDLFYRIRVLIAEHPMLSEFELRKILWLEGYRDLPEGRLLA